MSIVRRACAHALVAAGLVAMLIATDATPRSAGSAYAQNQLTTSLAGAQAVAGAGLAAPLVAPTTVAAPIGGTADVPEPPPPPPVAAPPAAQPAIAGGPPPVAAVSSQQALINADRAASGLPGLAWSSCLAGVAAQNAQRMAAAGAISHADGPSRDLGCGLGSSHAGENVGYWSGGIDDGRLNQMFMASPAHRENILGSYRYVGSAWVVAPNGSAYIAVEFA